MESRNNVNSNLKECLESNLSSDIMEITDEEFSTFIGVLVKIGLQKDMKKRNISNPDEYKQFLIKSILELVN